MPSPLDSYLQLLLSAERGEIQRSLVHWSMLAGGFSETEIMVTQTDAKSRGYTRSDNWGPDGLTVAGRARAASEFDQ